MNDTERLYRDSQEAILSLVTASNQHTPVPACPGWTVKDVIGHLTGALIDLATGNRPESPTPEWTAGHVAKYKDVPLDEVATKWREFTSTDAAASLFPHVGSHLLPDIGTHEFDVRGALGNADNRESDILVAVFDVVSQWLQLRFEAVNVPTLEIRAGGETRVIGDGAPVGVVSGSLYELARTIGGRRSRNQIRQLDWSTDPTPWLEHIAVLPIAQNDVIE